MSLTVSRSYIALLTNFYMEKKSPADSTSVEQQDFKTLPASGTRHSERLLFLLFILSLPLLNPWVRGDGVGYYALVRAPLIEHSLDFTHDYQNANPSFREPRLDEYGRPKPFFRTATGHLENHFSVGPAMLWAPFLLATHAGVLIGRAIGFSVPADGFSAPYRIAMAFATAFYSFLGLLLSFRLARQYVLERWALLATLAIWLASSLPVYMYFNPSWSHAHSAFAVALFIWYWHRTRSARSLKQWFLLALIAGLMLNVYYPNATVLVLLAVEAIRQYMSALRRRVDEATGTPSVSSLLARHSLFALILVLSLLPTFVTRYVIYGNPFESGYIPLSHWLWSSPAFLRVLFSSDHGLLLWTPILFFSLIGLFLFWRRAPQVGGPFLAAVLAFYIFIACYPDWAGISSYGNRFFVSLSSFFVIGLAFFVDRFSQFFRSQRTALIAAVSSVALLALWNAGLMFQWGAHIIPARGPVSLSEVAYNQIFVVPRELSIDLRRYFFKRKVFMQQIEQRDIQQLEESPAKE